MRARRLAQYDDAPAKQEKYVKDATAEVLREYETRYGALDVER
jgi:hypothetical protein